MAKETWALDLGEWSLKVVRGWADKKTGKLIVDLYDEIRYDSLEVAEDASSMDRFRAGLAEFGAKYQLPKKANLCVAVSGSEVFSRFINLPPVPESISEIIRYEARQQIPFDINEVVWDYQPLKEEHQPGEEIEVGLFALKQETVQEYMDLLEPWRRNLRIIQNAPLAAYNFLRFEGRVDEPMIVLDMGAATTDVLIVNHPRFWLRPLLVGGNAITERLQSHFGVSHQESQRIQERASESAREAQLLRVIRPVVGNMLSEIQRSLGYYKSLARGVKFTKILALGSAFRLRGLDRVLAEGLQYPIEGLTEWRNLQITAPLTEGELKENLGSACAALGLLVQGVGMGHISINLAPPELITAAVMARKKPFLAAAAAGIVAVAGIFLASERLYGQDLVSYEPPDVVDEILREDKLYREAASEAKTTTAQLTGLVTRKVARDVMLNVLPPLVQALPEDTVYVRQMSVFWGVPGRSRERLGAEPSVAGEEPLVGGRTPMTGTEGPMRPMIIGAGGVGMTDEAMAARARVMAMAEGGGGEEEERQPTLRRRGDTGGRMPYTPTTTAQKLIVAMDCESTVTTGPRAYVEKEVIEVLQQWRNANEELLFDKVSLVGTVKLLRRQAGDGRVVSGSAGGATDVIDFVAFSVEAVVNTGKGAGGADEGAERPRRSSAR